MYRSKDKAFMQKIKENVLAVTKGQEKEERKFAVDYLKKHVKLDDLHHYALEKFPNKTFYFGEGSLSPKIVVVTKDEITAEAKERLEKAWKKLELDINDIYYAFLRFVKTKKKQEDRLSIFIKLINILKPKLLIVFDLSEKDLEGIHENVEIYYVKNSTSILTDEEKATERKELTKTLRLYRKSDLI